MVVCVKFMHVLISDSQFTNLLRNSNGAQNRRNIYLPWCGRFQRHIVELSARTDVICGADDFFILTGMNEGCKKPITIITDKKGSVSVTQKETSELTLNNQKTSGSLIKVNGNFYGSVAVGEKATAILNVYNDTLKAIDDAKNISKEQKKQAERTRLFQRLWPSCFYNCSRNNQENLGI